MDKPTCKTCRFGVMAERTFALSGTHVGIECHRRAPAASGGWPLIQAAAQWCGEHEPREQVVNRIDTKETPCT